MNWRGIFINNLGWKLFSLLIALVVWSTYHLSGGSFLFTGLAGETDSVNYAGFRPRILLRQGDNRRFRLQPEQVRITISGLPNDVNQLDVKDILAYVDAQDYQDGNTNLVTVHVNVGPNLVVSKVQPDKVVLEQIPEQFHPND